MLKEDLLRSYLEDDLFIEKKYLIENEFKDLKWTSHSENDLIQVIKSAIEGVVNNESANSTERKINLFLNKSS